VLLLVCRLRSRGCPEFLFALRQLPERVTTHEWT
jgi:hypothetical protein